MKHWTKERLLKLGLPAVLVPGILAAIAFGFKPEILETVKDFHQIEAIFPKAAVIKTAIDGDTVLTEDGRSLRLLGINSPEKGQPGYEESKQVLAKLAAGKKVDIEYDRETFEPFGRLMVWLWLNCEATPQFLPYDYMHLSKNASQPGLTANPEGCQEGVLVNEALVDQGWAQVQTNPKHGELKYEARLRQ